MVLPLLTPQGTNFIKDWTSQNTVNCDLIDDYAGPCLVSDGLQSYNPVLDADTTTPVLGSGGFLLGYYYRIFDQIFSWGEFRFGTSGINKGAGNYSITLPFKAKTILGANSSSGQAPILGEGIVWDDSLDAGRQGVIIQLRTVTTMQFQIRADSGMNPVVAGGDIPIVWATLDGITWSVRYQRDPT